MNFILLEKFKETEEYEKFLQDNPSLGTLKVEVFTANESIPIPNTQVLITKNIDNNDVLFYKGVTSSSGIIDNVSLPAPNPVLNASYDNELKYTIYDLTAINDDFETIKKYKIAMFGDIKVIQYVKMIPKIDIEGAKDNGN